MDARNRQNARRVVAASSVLATAAVVFSSAARLPFLSDDYLYLETARQPGWWHAGTIWNPSGAPLSHLYRPFLYVWFGVLYHVFGLHPFVFHVVTGLVVVVAAVMISAVGRRLGLHSGAYIAAVVYCLHASMATPIGWTSAASSPLATAFALGAVYILLRPHVRARDIVASSLLLAVALMTREVVAVTPALAFICVWIIGQGEPWLQRVRRSIVVSSPLWLVVVAYAAVRRSSGFDSTLGPYRQSIGTHAFTNLWRVMQYATEFGESTHLGGLVAAFWAVLVLLCVHATTRSHLPQGLVGLAWAFLAVLPVIFLASHRMEYYYIDFALPGVALAVGTVFQSIFEMSSKTVRSAAAAACVAGLASVGFYTARQEQRSYLDIARHRSAAIVAYVARHDPHPAKGSTIQLPITAAEAAFQSYQDRFRVMFNDSSLNIAYKPLHP